MLPLSELLIYWYLVLPFVYALQEGKHIHCEKPLANYIEEINIMERAAHRHNSVVQVGHHGKLSDKHWQDAA